MQHNTITHLHFIVLSIIIIPNILSFLFNTKGLVLFRKSWRTEDDVVSFQLTNTCSKHTKETVETGTTPGVFIANFDLN